MGGALDLAGLTNTGQGFFLKVCMLLCCFGVNFVDFYKLQWLMSRTIYLYLESTLPSLMVGLLQSPAQCLFICTGCVYQPGQNVRVIEFYESKIRNDLIGAVRLAIKIK